MYSIVSQIFMITHACSSIPQAIFSFTSAVDSGPLFWSKMCRKLIVPITVFQTHLKDDHKVNRSGKLVFSGVGMTIKSVFLKWWLFLDFNDKVWFQWFGIAAVFFKAFCMTSRTTVFHLFLHFLELIHYFFDD